MKPLSSTVTITTITAATALDSTNTIDRMGFYYLGLTASATDI
jgi:hypothetical protein